MAVTGRAEAAEAPGKGQKAGRWIDGAKGAASRFCVGVNPRCTTFRTVYLTFV